MSKQYINYLIFSTNEEQILVKRANMEDTYGIEFLTYDEKTKQELSYLMGFKEQTLRDNIFENLLSPQNTYAKNFVADIYKQYLSKPSRTIDPKYMSITASQPK